MNRRDFLFFRKEGSQRVAELSCEKLFMHYQDLSSGFQQAAEEEGSLDGADWWAGEPSLLVNSIEPDVFFRKILEELSEIEAVTVQDMEWLAQPSGGFPQGVRPARESAEARRKRRRLARWITGWVRRFQRHSAHQSCEPGNADS